MEVCESLWPLGFLPIKDLAGDYRVLVEVDEWLIVVLDYAPETGKLGVSIVDDLAFAALFPK